MPNEEINDRTEIQVIDFNGDGKSDFALFDRNGLRIFTINNGQLTLLHHQNNIPQFQQHFFGDFNGDGKSDLLMPVVEGQDAWTFICLQV